jgi:putative FmdB family regulatory protein
MPIYEYRCQKCDAFFETIVFRASAPVTCPKCLGDEVERQSSTFGIGGSRREAGASASCGGCKRSSCAGCR